MYLEKEKVEAFYQAIQDADTIIIHRHQRPDPDALGSQLGLKALIEHQFPEKRVLAAGTTTKGLAWMGDMDPVIDEDYREALVIVTDTANQPRVDGELFNQGQKLIKIDHHPNEDPYGALEMVYPQASAASEIIALISHTLKDRLPMTDLAAQRLYAGILGDTGRFLFNSTSATTFQMAAFLINYDFDAYALSDRFNTLTKAQAQFQGYVYDHLVFEEAAVAHITITQDILKEYGITEEESNSVVGIPGRIEGIYSWVIFIEQAGGPVRYRCRMRSKGPIINGLASQYDGGGHPLASGANAYSDEEKDQLVQDLIRVATDYSQNQ